MKTSSKGINLIKEFEGCVLTAYKCPAGVWTIGYGHTGKVDNKSICDGMMITKAKATSLLKKDLERFEKAVAKYDAKYHWNQNQFDALVSFAYNIGSIDQLTSKGTRSIAQISAKIPEYNKASGKVLAGLTRRRKAEKELFDKPIPNKSQKKNSYTVIVTPLNGLNVRKGPGINFEKIKALRHGKTVDVLEESNGWGRTSDGWICLKYTAKV